MRLALSAAAIFLATALSASAQYYPPPPGSPPQPDEGNNAPSAKQRAEDALLATFTGTLKGIARKSLLLEDESGNELPLHINRKTTFTDSGKKLKLGDLKPGVPLSVDARRFADGSLDAVHVRVEHPKKQKLEGE